MKQPDLSAPRITEVKGRVFTRQDIAAFNKKYPEHGGLTQAQFTNIVRTFNETMREETLINPHGVMLPEKLGIIALYNVGRVKMKSVNFLESKKQNKIVYHKNWDTDNNKLQIVFHSRIFTYVKNMRLYSFTATKFFKTQASEYFKKNWTKCLKLIKPKKYDDHS